MKKWLARLAPALVLALCQFSLMAQGPAARNGSWADETLKQDGHATPPPELADAVLAPRHLNVTLSTPRGANGRAAADGGSWIVHLRAKRFVGPAVALAKAG